MLRGLRAPPAASQGRSLRRRLGRFCGLLVALPDGFELLPQFVPLPLGFLQLPAPLLEFVHRLVGPALVLHYVETLIPLTGY